jgi:hypothetical protein
MNANRNFRGPAIAILVAQATAVLGHFFALQLLPEFGLAAWGALALLLSAVPALGVMMAKKSQQVPAENLKRLTIFYVIGLNLLSMLAAVLLAQSFVDGKSILEQYGAWLLVIVFTFGAVFQWRRFVLRNE